jgi:hydrogenase nickel insertion protein HypA
MHEIGIAHTIIETVLKSINNQPGVRVHTIGIKVGAMAGILEDSLEFSFNALKKGTALETSSLKIESIAATGLCEKCKHRFIVDNLVFLCPKCNYPLSELENGQELDITYLDIEEEEN